MKNTIPNLTLIACIAIPVGASAFEPLSIPMQRNNNSAYPYQGPSGQRYKYDMSQPMDRLNYQNDYMSQIQDNLKRPVNPRTMIDNTLMRSGAGLE